MNISDVTSGNVVSIRSLKNGRTYRICDLSRKLFILYFIFARRSFRYIRNLFQLLLIVLSHGNDHSGQQQRYDPTIPWHIAPPWAYILREIILKSVTPSNNNAPHARPLDVSFYGGTTAARSNADMNVVLSRGNVYRLLNGHWMLCQDGCVDCEPCAAQRNPLFKWILRRVMRSPPVSDPPRHDLQLTIMPQADNHLHAGNLWPNSYIYVTSQGKRAPPDVPINGTQHNEDNEQVDSLSNLESSFSAQHHRSKDHGRLTERDSRGDEIPHEEVGSRAAVVSENASSTEKIEREDSFEQKHRFKNTRRQRPRPAEKSAEEASRLTPTLILGTDQRGQRYLVHVVPADQLSAYSSSPISSRFITGQATTTTTTTTPTDNTIPKRQTYQRIFRRVFDSLNTHRRSIENFLESSASNVDGMPFPTDNIEAAGFTWNNRDAGANLRPLRLNGSSLPFFHVESEDKSDGYQQYRRRHDYEDTKRNDRHSGYRDGNRAKTLRGRSPAIFDWGRERRKVRVKPYFIDDTNISRINTSSILPRKLVNSSANSVPRFGFGNVFVINSAGQIDFNDTFVDRTNNNSVELNAITKIQENERSFDSDRLKSGDANREYEASHHPFRVIVTTELPVIRREHETLNRTTTLQITTLKDAR